MALKLTPEQRAALKHQGSPVPVEDDETHEVFFLVDKPTLDELHRQNDLDAVREGFADLENGRLMTLDELDLVIKATLDLPVAL